MKIRPEVLMWLAPSSSFRTQLSYLALSSTKHFLWTGMYPALSQLSYPCTVTSIHVSHSMLTNLLQWASLCVSTTASLLYDTSQHNLACLQRVQNSLARAVTQAPCHSCAFFYFTCIICTLTTRPLFVLKIVRIIFGFLWYM